MLKTQKTMEVFTNIHIPLLSNEDTIYTHVIIGKKELSYDYFVINHPVNKEYIDYYAHLDNKVLHEKIVNPSDSCDSKDFTVLEKTFAQSISDHYDCVISAYYVGIPKDYDLAVKIKNTVGYPFVSSLMGIDDCLSDEAKVRKIVDRDFNFRNSLEVHMINRCVGIGDFNYENNNGIFSIFKYLELSCLDKDNYRFPRGKEVFNNDNIQEFQLNLLWYIILYHLMQSENENTVKELVSEKETLDSIIDSFNNTSLSDSDNEYCAFLAYMITSQNNPLNINYYNTIEKRNLLLGLSKNNIIQLFNKSSLVSPDYDSYYDIKDDYVKYCKVFKDDSVTRLENTLSYWFDQLSNDDELSNSITYENIMGVAYKAYMRNVSNIYSRLLDKPNSLNDDDLNDILSVDSLKNQLSVKIVGDKHIKTIVHVLNVFGKDYIENSIKLSHLYTLIQLGKDTSLFPNLNSFKFIDLIKKFNMDKHDDDSLLEFLCNIYVNFKTIRLNDDFLDSDDDISVYNDINPEMFFNIYNISYEYRNIHPKALKLGYMPYMPYHIGRINKMGF